MKFDFIKISNILFKDKKIYSQIEDSDKEYNFFILNRKLAKNFIKQAQFLNSKFIDKASALDIWFNFINKKNINTIPGWWYNSDLKKEKEKNSNISKSDKALLLKYHKLKDDDFEFLFKYKNAELQEELKKLKKFS
jgi:hypothetical protein